MRGKSIIKRTLKSVIITAFVLCAGSMVSEAVSLAACCEITTGWGEKRYYDTFSEGWCYTVQVANSDMNQMTTIKLLTNWEASDSKQTIKVRGEKYTIEKYNLGTDLRRKDVEGLDSSRTEVDGFSGGHLNVNGNRRITIDLNGFNIDRRRGDKQGNDGEVINVSNDSYLHIIDSNPGVNRSIDGIQVNGGAIMGGASKDGAGGIHIKGEGTVEMEGGNICCNQTNDHGGAIKLDSSKAKLLLDGVHLFRNKTRNADSNTNGGAIYINSGRARIRNCVFRKNESEDFGGAVFSDEGDSYVVIENCQFIDNYAKDDGGAIYIDRGSLNVRDTSFTGNSAKGKGGAVFIEDDDGAVFHTCTFTNNRAGGHGGGFYVDDDNTYFIDCDFHGNKSDKNGGGVYIDHEADISFQGVMKVYDNLGAGDRGDDVYFDPESHLYSGGLLDGSRIGVRTGKKFAALKNITQYEYETCFYSNQGSFKTSVNSTTDETYLSSVFFDGGFWFIGGIILVILAGLISGLVIRSGYLKKRAEGKN